MFSALNDLAPFFAAISAIGAFAAAAAAAWQVRAAIQTNQAQLYLEFSNRYNAKEINDAIIALIDWQKSTGSDFAEVFKTRFLARSPDALQVNIHRRNLNRYFLDAAKAHETKLLNPRLAGLVADQPGATIWVQICEPMTCALFGVPRSKHMRTLQGLVPSFGLGVIF
jgi:hypothetical protein